MSGRRILFLDRDGTLNEETADEQIDSLEKVRLMPGVVPALLELKAAGFAFVMVTNQDGLGTARFPQENFARAHQFILDLFSTQGIEFEAVFVCPHFKHEGCACRKPGIGMVKEYLAAEAVDTSRSYMIGDRDTDMEFATNLRLQGLRIRLDGEAHETWPGIVRRILGRARRAAGAPQDQGDRRACRGRPVARGSERDRHRPGLFRPYAGTDRQARGLCARTAMHGRSAHR